MTYQGRLSEEVDQKIYERILYDLLSPLHEASQQF